MTEVGSLSARRIFAVVALPVPWPPQRGFPIGDERVGSGEFRAAFDSAGRLVVDVVVGGMKHTHAFQPIDAQPTTRITLAIWWDSPANVGASINGIDLLPEKFTAGEHFAAVAGSMPTRSVGLERHLVPAHLQSEERLFLETLNDLVGRISSGTRYDLLRASALVRQLLTDSGSLISAVNRRYRLKLSFETLGDAAPPLQPDAWWRNPDPSGFPGAQTEVRNLDQFLAFRCLGKGDYAAKVVHVISAAANVKGGVHLGRPDSPEDEIVLAWDDAFTIGGEHPSLQALKGIAVVTLVGLRPLAAAILGSSIRHA